MFELISQPFTVEGELIVARFLVNYFNGCGVGFVACVALPILVPARYPARYQGRQESAGAHLVQSKSSVLFSPLQFFLLSHPAIVSGFVSATIMAPQLDAGAASFDQGITGITKERV